jgi:plastocyanin
VSNQSLGILIPQFVGLEVFMGKRLMVRITILMAILLVFLGFARYAFAYTVHDTAALQSPALNVRPSQTTSIKFGGTLGFNYSPKFVFIQPGDSLQWQGDFTMHPLVSDEGLWPTNSGGSTFTFAFTKPGVYHWHCFFHGPIGMVGTVIVGPQQFIPFITR